MTDDPDPFGPIGEHVDIQNMAPDEALIVTPVPADAECVGEAATRLFGRRPDYLWHYEDNDGRLLFVVARWDLPEEGKKAILPLSWVKHPGGREAWRFKNHPSPRPLFNLNLLARSPTAPVVVVEGEKCADVAQRVFPDSVVTTSPGGAGAPAKANWTPLAKRSQVLIWPDADPKGMAYANQVASILYDLEVLGIRIVDPLAVAARNPDGSTREPIPGWDVAEAVSEGWAIDALRDAVNESARLWTHPGSQNAWPDDFEMTLDGLVKIERKDGQIKKFLFTGPFSVSGEGRDLTGAGRGLWITWKDRDSREQRGFVRYADLVGEGVDWLKDITDRGFRGPILRNRIGWLRLALYGCRPANRIRLVRRTGWVGSAFVLPHKTIGNTGSEAIMFDGRSDIGRYCERGTIEDWKKYVAAPAIGNARLIFAQSAAFAGPIADLLDEGSFGFNLIGPSSIGKSVALIAAGSVWGGGGPLGFAYSWRTTDNGAEGTFCAHSGTFVPLDELGQLPAEVASALAYMFGNGHGKSRATRNGEARRTAEWRGVLLSTGEVSIASKIDELGRGRKAKAGQLIRLLDIFADAGKGNGLFDDCHGEPPAQFAQRLRASAMTYYGIAGPEFVNYMAHSFGSDPTEAKAELRMRVDSWQKQLLQGVVGSDGQVTRAARYFAILAVAGELAQVGLDLPWAEGESFSAARTCFTAWLTQRGGSDPQEILTAITALREAIEIHGQARFQHLNGLIEDEFENTNTHPLRDMLGYRFVWQHETVWGFTSAGLKEVLRGVGEIGTLVTALAERGLIRRGSARRLQIEKKIGGYKRRLYAVPDTLVFGEIDDTSCSA
jgi:putative DNA primase/helicase